MSEQIKPGDLVMVVRTDHKCAETMLGRVYIVDGVPAAHPGIACERCGEADIAIANAPIITLERKGKTLAMPSRWLKKIGPPARPQDEETQKELTA